MSNSSPRSNRHSLVCAAGSPQRASIACSSHERHEPSMSGPKAATRLLPGDGLGFLMMRSEADPGGFPLFISHSPVTGGSPSHASSSAPQLQTRADAVPAASRASEKSSQPPRAEADDDASHHSPPNNHPRQSREQQRRHQLDGHHSHHHKSGLPRKQRTRSSRMECHACGTGETPEWRCGPDGLGTLCNVCGLVFAKQQRRRSEP